MVGTMVGSKHANAEYKVKGQQEKNQKNIHIQHYQGLLQAPQVQQSDLLPPLLNKGNFNYDQIFNSNLNDPVIYSRVSSKHNLNSDQVRSQIGGIFTLGNSANDATQDKIFSNQNTAQPSTNLETKDQNYHQPTNTFNNIYMNHTEHIQKPKEAKPQKSAPRSLKQQKDLMQLRFYQTLTNQPNLIKEQRKQRQRDLNYNEISQSINYGLINPRLNYDTFGVGSRKDTSGNIEQRVIQQTGANTVKPYDSNIFQSVRDDTGTDKLFSGRISGDRGVDENNMQFLEQMHLHEFQLANEQIMRGMVSPFVSQHEDQPISLNENNTLQSLIDVGSVRYSEMKYQQTNASKHTPFQNVESSNNQYKSTVQFGNQQDLIGVTESNEIQQRYISLDLVNQLDSHAQFHIETGVTVIVDQSEIPQSQDINLNIKQKQQTGQTITDLVQSDNNASNLDLLTVEKPKRNEIIASYQFKESLKLSSITDDVSNAQNLKSNDNLQSTTQLDERNSAQTLNRAITYDGQKSNDIQHVSIKRDKELSSAGSIRQNKYHSNKQKPPIVIGKIEKKQSFKKEQELLVQGIQSPTRNDNFSSQAQDELLQTYFQMSNVYGNINDNQMAVGGVSFKNGKTSPGKSRTKLDNPVDSYGQQENQIIPQVQVETRSKTKMSKAKYPANNKEVDNKLTFGKSSYEQSMRATTKLSSNIGVSSKSETAFMGSQNNVMAKLRQSISQNQGTNSLGQNKNFHLPSNQVLGISKIIAGQRDQNFSLNSFFQENVFGTAYNFQDKELFLNQRREKIKTAQLQTRGLGGKKSQPIVGAFTNINMPALGNSDDLKFPLLQDQPGLNQQKGLNMKSGETIKAKSLAQIQTQIQIQTQNYNDNNEINKTQKVSGNQTAERENQTQYLIHESNNKDGNGTDSEANSPFKFGSSFEHRTQVNQLQESSMNHHHRDYENGEILKVKSTERQGELKDNEGERGSSKLFQELGGHSMLSNDNEINLVKTADDKIYEESLNTEAPYHYRPKTQAIDQTSQPRIDMAVGLDKIEQVISVKSKDKQPHVCKRFMQRSNNPTVPASQYVAVAVPSGKLEHRIVVPTENLGLQLFSENQNKRFTEFHQSNTQKNLEQANYERSRDIQKLIGRSPASNALVQGTGLHIYKSKSQMRSRRDISKGKISKKKSIDITGLKKDGIEGISLVGQNIHSTSGELNHPISEQDPDAKNRMFGSDQGLSQKNIVSQRAGEHSSKSSDLDYDSEEDEDEDDEPLIIQLMESMFSRKKTVKESQQMLSNISIEQIRLEFKALRLQEKVRIFDIERSRIFQKRLEECERISFLIKQNNPDFSQSQLKQLEHLQFTEDKDNKFFVALKTQQQQREQYKELLQLAIIQEQQEEFVKEDGGIFINTQVDVAEPKSNSKSVSKQESSQSFKANENVNKFFMLESRFQLPRDYFKQLGTIQNVQQQQTEVVRHIIFQTFPELAIHGLAMRIFLTEKNQFNIVFQAEKQKVKQIDEFQNSMFPELLNKPSVMQPLSSCCKMAICFVIDHSIGGSVRCLDNLCAYNPIQRVISQEISKLIAKGSIVNLSLRKHLSKDKIQEKVKDLLNHGHYVPKYDLNGLYPPEALEKDSKGTYLNPLQLYSGGQTHVKFQKQNMLINNVDQNQIIKYIYNKDDSATERSNVTQKNEQLKELLGQYYQDYKQGIFTDEEQGGIQFIDDDDANLYLNEMDAFQKDRVPAFS